MTNFRKNKFGIYQEPRQKLPQYGSVKENRRLGWGESETQQNPQMLGFVPQPNLRRLRFLNLTEPYWELPCWLSEVETLSFNYAQEPPTRINTYKFPHHAYKQRNQNYDNYLPRL